MSNDRGTSHNPKLNVKSNIVERHLTLLPYDVTYGQFPHLLYTQGLEVAAYFPHTSATLAARKLPHVSPTSTFYFHVAV